MELLILDGNYILVEKNGNGFTELCHFDSKEKWETFICEFNIIRKDYWDSTVETKKEGIECLDCGIL